MGIVATTVNAGKSVVGTGKNIAKAVTKYQTAKTDSVFKKKPASQAFNQSKPQPVQPAKPKTTYVSKQKPSQFNSGNKGAFKKTSKTK